MRTLSILFLCLAACFAVAQPQFNQFDQVTLGTNTSGSATMNIRGYVDTVYVSVSDGVSTGAVTLAYAPALGGTAVNIATNSVVDEKVWRPVVDRTSVAGVDLTSDDPAPFVLVGETLTFSVSGSPTGLVWKCLVVTEDRR